MVPVIETIRATDKVTPGAEALVHLALQWGRIDDG